MKRLATLIFFIIIICGITCFSIKADTEYDLGLIICEQSKANFNDLDEDFVYSYSGNINFNEEGKYTINYILKNGETKNRDVIVASSESIQNGIAYTKYKNSIDMKRYGAVNGSIIYDGTNYYSYINETYNNNIQACIYYNENDAIKAHNVFESIRIIDMLVYLHQTYVLYQYKESDLSKIGVMIINNNCDSIRDMRYSSNKQEEGIKLLNVNNSLYVLFNTTSNIGIIERSDSFKIAALISINQLSLRKESQMIIANDNESSFTDVCADYDKPYFLISFIGTKGSYYNSYNKLYTGKMIVSFDRSPYVLASIPSAFENDNVIWSNNGYYLMTKYNSSNIIDISYNDYKDSLKSYSKSLRIDNNITSIYAFSYLDKLTIALNEDNIIYSFTQISKEEINNLTFYDITYKIDNVKIHNNEIYLMSYNGNIYLYNLNVYHIEKNKRTKLYQGNYETEYENISLYNNDIKLNSENISKLNEEYYGKYDVKTIISSNNIKIISSSYHIIPLICNIESDEIYDLNLPLVFNGTAYLNNSPIESGYIIEEVGNYQLDIYGVNDLKHTIIFQVKDKSLHEKAKPLDNKDDHYQYMEYNEEKTYLSNNSYDVILYDNKESFKYAIIFVLIMSFVAVCFLIFKKKRGERK